MALRRPAPVPAEQYSTTSGSWLSVALPRTADDCYELFCHAERTPEWLSIIRSAVVVRRDGQGRARVAAYLARLQRATVGYTLHFRYHGLARRIAWATPKSVNMRVRGHAQFTPLNERACMMQYRLDIYLAEGCLPGWHDPQYNDNAASAALLGFRDFALRTLTSSR